MNRIILLGRLTKDPEVRYTNTGKVVCQFTLAVDRPFANQEGQREADFIPVVIWGKQAENLCKYCGKGSQIAVNGALKIRSYDKDGVKKYVTEVLADGFNGIEFLSKGNNAGGSNSGTNNNQGGFDEDFGAPIDDGDMPF